MKFHITVVIALITNLYSATFDAVTAYPDDNHQTGYRPQIEYIPNNTFFNDVQVGVNYNVPYDTLPLNVEPGHTGIAPYNQYDWCQNGTVDFKVYIPANAKYFRITLQSSPNQTFFGFATYKPNPQTGIDEVAAKQKGLMLPSEMYPRLFNAHKTVLFVIRDSYAFVVDDYNRQNYGIDIGQGGYLYISLAQAPKVYDSFYGDYYRNQRILVGYSLRLDKTGDWMQTALKDVPLGNYTEPYEPPVYMRKNVCAENGDRNFHLISTEPGTLLTPAEQCQNVGGVYDAAYDTCQCNIGSDLEGIYDYAEGRCVSTRETACKADSAHRMWIARTAECLWRDSNDVPTGDALEPQTQVDAVSATMKPYVANEEGWVSDLRFVSANATGVTAYKVKILNSDKTQLYGERTVEISPYSLDSDQRWSGRLEMASGTLSLVGPDNSIDDVNQSVDFSGAPEKGVVVVEPVEPDPNLALFQGTPSLHYYKAVQTVTSSSSSSSSIYYPPASSSSSVAAPCPTGTIRAGNICVQVGGGSSSSVYYPPASSSSSYSSVYYPPVSSSSAGQSTCPAGTILAGNNCVQVGGGSSSSVYYPPASSSSAGQSTCPAGTILAGNICVQTGGGSSTSSSSSESSSSEGSFWCQTGQWFGTDALCEDGSSSSSETSVSSSSVSSAVSSSSQPQEDEPQTPVFDDSQSPLPSSMEALAVRSFLMLKEAELDVSGYFVQYPFEGVEAKYQWAFVTPDGKVYQLRGNAPSDNDVFGWKRRDDITIPEDAERIYMTAIYNWIPLADNRFAWLLFVPASGKTYKLSGVTESGLFSYTEPLKVRWTIKGGKVAILTDNGENLPGQTTSSSNGAVSSAAVSSSSSSEANTQEASSSSVEASSSELSSSSSEASSSVTSSASSSAAVSSQNTADTNTGNPFPD